MTTWETIGFIALCVVFLGLVICLPLIIDGALKSTVPFKAKKAYDITYENGILSFKTETRKRAIQWKFRGDCTVWRWYTSNKRCTTMEEWELCQIWERAKNFDDEI